jgi:chromosomal replication initiation ATPase DnaA
VNFIRDFNEQIKMFRDKYSNAEFLIIGNFHCMGERQVELPHLFDVWENWNAESYNLASKRSSKGKSCIAEGKKLTDFCETNNVKILN